ncbi:MAG: spermidine/putrescine ABC transporter permease [Epsilonproteobacteria bacterium]|nr:spermidine/putrescine ABC transporter permease [Campylobacterota bacterium]|tara:strand:- start:803 stop:1582 length:780 start_codon:yes stop_codon:yes gene_type:complete
MVHVSRLSKTLFLLLVSAVYIFLYTPIIVLILYSFNKGGFPDIWRGFSLHWYQDLLHSVEIWRAFQNSVIVALTSSVFSVMMAVCFIHGSRRYGRDFTKIFYSNVIVSDIVLAVGMLTLFSALAVPLGLTTIIAGHTLLGLGFTIPVIKGRYDELDDSLIEASLDLGASSQYTFFHVIIPFLYPAILSSFLLAIIVSFDDFLIAFFCSGASVQTLSLYIFSMIRSGISPVVNALSTLLLVVSLLMIVIMLMFQKNILRK